MARTEDHYLSVTLKENLLPMHGGVIEARKYFAINQDAYLAVFCF